MRGVSINGTRIAGALSLIALIIATYSDLTLTGFWDHNAMATSMVADILVLLVGVAVVNEYITTRSMRSWKLLADYAIVDMAQIAALVWIHLAEEIGLGDRKQISREEL